MVQLVSVTVIFGSGLVAGVFFAVAVSVLPALSAMPPDRYVQTHHLLGKGYHPTMPLLVNATLLADIVLVLLTDSWTARALLLVSIVGILVVEAVSHLCNVPLNKLVRQVADDTVPADWHDPRPLWRRWHGIRTISAFVVLLLNGLAVTLGH
ncbi:anthrone oxygenase family protein [Streptomyces sp. NPDC006309]|uniref:anthrone oxygenase family protein n=1 Tax=Streptomyces sp. NPDC006309 TaxID=3156749 RepID=UPI0033AA47C2